MAERDDDAAFPLGASLDFLRHLWRLNHALERASLRMDRRIGLTAQQRFLLRCIGRYPGITPGDAARVLHVDPGTVSSTIRRLEGKGLVARRRDPADRRRVTLGLTPAGRALDGSDPRTVEGAIDKLLAQATGAEIDATVATLVRLERLIDEEPE